MSEVGSMYGGMGKDVLLDADVPDAMYACMLS